jgi:signal peptide peptidase SppA
MLQKLSPLGARLHLDRVLPAAWFEQNPVVPVLRFSGAIGAVTPLRPGLTLATAAPLIERAFATPGAKAVAVQINSPGGSAAQSMMIHRRIRALADEKGLKVYAFAEDVAASGGYLLALAGDEIYAEEASIVGSIGVVSASFGLDRFIQRYDIDRRVYTAGEKKYALDPFQPERAEDVDRLKAVQRDVHEAFIRLVKERRGARLTGADDTLFTGAFWSGPEAAGLGLIDGMDDVRGRMRALFGEKVRLKLIAPERSWLRRVSRGVQAGDGGGGAQPLAYLGDELLSAIETRALWSRFGL